jgi:hypothetical protein
MLRNLGGYHWPSPCALEETLEAFECAYALLGYSKCRDGELEDGIEKAPSMR